MGSAIGTSLNELNSIGNADEDANSEGVLANVGEKESRGRGIRNEVAERVRLRTNSQAIDSPDPDDGAGADGKEPTPTPAPTSKRKKPPPPPTMYVLFHIKVLGEANLKPSSAAKRARLGDALVAAPLHGPATTTVLTTASTPLLASTHVQATQEDDVIDQRLSSSKRALSAAQKRSMVGVAYSPILISFVHISP